MRRKKAISGGGGGGLALFYCLLALTCIVSQGYGQDSSDDESGEASSSSSSSPRSKHVTAILYRRAQFECSVKSPENAAEVEIWWQFQDKNVTSHKVKVSKSAEGVVVSELTIDRVTWEDGGTYTCLVREINAQDSLTKQDVQLEIIAEPKKVSSTDGSGKMGGSTRMSCVFQGKPLPTIQWKRHGKQLESDDVKYSVSQEDISHKERASYLDIFDLNHLDNGTYMCIANNEYNLADKVALVNAIVFDAPVVELDLVKAVEKDMVFVNWTINHWNSPVTDYYISYRKTGDDAWVNYFSEQIATDASSFVVKGLDPDTGYLFKLGAKNRYGRSRYSEHAQEVRTLDWSPSVFVPSASLRGLTWNSISIRWTSPDDLQSGLSEKEKMARNFKEYIHNYKLTRKTDDHTLNVYQSTGEYPFYLWENLEADTDYAFTVSACNGYTNICGPPSNKVTATTEDGLSGPPSNVNIECKQAAAGEGGRGASYVDVTWQPPLKPNGQIEFYNIWLKGVSTYNNAEGLVVYDKMGPEIKTVSNEVQNSGGPTQQQRKLMRTRFDFLSPNTKYNASVCAVTRRKDCGEDATVSCQMPAMPPDPEQMKLFQWSNGKSPTDKNREVFRLRTPKLSERNGPICCLRVVVVKMKPGASLDDVKNLPLSTYRKTKESWGAYIAEILGPNALGNDVIVGDGKNIIAAASTPGRSRCPACWYGVHAQLLTPAKSRKKRNVVAPTELVEDGSLDLDANYTAYVEVIVPENTVGRSPYMIPHKPGEVGYLSGAEGGSQGGGRGGAVNTVLICVLGVLAGLVTVSLFLLLALLFLRRYSKQVAASQGSSGVEMDLMRSLRHFISNTLRIGGRDHSQYLITPNGEPNASGRNGGGAGSATGVGKRHHNNATGEEEWKPAPLPAIPAQDLVSAYLERHKDSDYGFQAEFEKLPDICSYPDRTTTEACDRPVNACKNRYPDIRCFDQTRVKLTPLTTIPQFGPGGGGDASTASPTTTSSGSENGDSVDGATAAAVAVVGAPPPPPLHQSTSLIDGSDYINANFVNGYKSRKRWICAQGPLERTIADFWRMIYEQGTSMIIMLTNLEEYNRIKCAQYWPSHGNTNYVVSPHCLINVGFCTEKRYSDYIVRELKMTVKTQKKEEDKAVETKRIVRHYHYLQWKDFNAPEHAPGMLRFIKRINEQHFRTTTTSSTSGASKPSVAAASTLPPIVVHCSAGVGRSGTLIAIDNLMQELEEEGKVHIYKTVCELRRSRNYLVQSVKQYMFVYRAIMEMAQFGDTEIDSSDIKSTSATLIAEDDRIVKSAGSKSNSNNSSKLGQEFAKLANIVDDRKALSVGTNEENRQKNQGEQVIPFDRNRVILTPEGMRPHSTYINASFIEGYHNDESFIITQDPMRNTVEDFWRMVTEHKIRTMVQLTDIITGGSSNSSSSNNGDNSGAGVDESSSLSPAPSSSSAASSAAAAPSSSQRWLYYPEKKEEDSGLTFSEFGSMRVSLDAVEDHAFYTMRELTVYNGKADESVKLTHFAYKNWHNNSSKKAAAAGTAAVNDSSSSRQQLQSDDSCVQLPDTTQGLLDLVEHATAHKAEMKWSGPIAVHCKYGSDRSSVYVALSCLVQQLKTESRADVFTVVRKLRSQRQGMIQSPSQYKFIYKAIADYVDLYNSKDDEEYQYSLPVNAVSQNNQMSSRTTSPHHQL